MPARVKFGHMRTAICLLVIAIPTAYWIGLRHGRSQPEQTPASATDVFNLRTECANLTQGIADANKHLAVGSVLSHYDVRANRCYAELHVDSADRLYDAQTREILAEIWDGKEGFIKGGPEKSTPKAVRAFIDRVMSDDRDQ